MAYVGPQPSNLTDIVGWQPNPSTRGTADILTSCLITLGLCIWSALHLNVVGKDGSYTRFWAKIGWLLVSLIAPEVVAAMALAQRQQAKSLAAHMNRKLGLPPPPGLYTRSISAARSKYRALKQMVSKWKPVQAPVHELVEDPGATLPTTEIGPLRNANRKHTWTLKHGFFANMGGFGLHVPPLPDHIRFLPKESDEARYIITRRGIEFLARFPDALKDIPDLSVEDIDALSRASAFAKLVVCFQATWFIFQVLLRLAHRLPVSLLELNTIAHALCVLLTYSCWWHKPFDVEKAVYLQSRFLHPAAADLQTRIAMSSVAKLWREQALSFIADQEAYYQFRLKRTLHSFWLSRRPVNLKDHLREEICDSEVVGFHSDAPNQPDADAFVRFCTQENNNQTTTPIIMTEVSWAEPVPGTGMRFRSSLPTLCFREFYPAWPLIVLAGLPFFGLLGFITWIEHASRGRQGFAILAVLGFPFVMAIIPQLRRPPQPVMQPMTKIFPSTTKDILTQGWLVREPRDSHVPPHPPSDDMAAFLATNNNRTTLHIERCDAILLEAASQHFQIGAPITISPTRLSEVAAMKSTGYTRQDWRLLAPFIFYTMLYGAMHLMGLEATFRYNIIKVLWTSSSIIVTSGLLVAGLVSYTFLGLRRWFRIRIEPHLEQWRDSMRLTWLRIPILLMKHLTTPVLMSIYWPVVATLVMVYLNARAFLLVWSFIALTYQPRAVYEVRPWASYWPHIS